MSALRTLEASLDDVFAKNAPALPSNAKKIIVEYLPYVSVFLGTLTLLAAWGLYDAARTVNTLIDYAGSFDSVYGSGMAVNHLTATVWLSIAVLVIEGLLYIAAFKPAKERKKSGWDLLFYALLINMAYGIIITFTYYGGLGRLLGTLIGSAAGLYFLFQIRASYKVRSTKKASR
ncbi:MAG TPA: hypothetical protein VFX84_02465 [Candidatus Saccharimonadales bacterium]|nr:hypothetical protein [Candidatus Saccharimonadales bacterium]